MNALSASLYILVLGANLFSSKFVLTSIGFRYPMVFQGWQTLVGFILYRFFHMLGLIKITSIDISGYISLFPVFLFFTASILTGSMALAHLPLLPFIAISGLVPVILDFFIGEGGNTKGSRNFKLGVAGQIIVCNLIVLAIEQTFWKSESYFWLEIHVVCQIGLVMYGKITDARFDAIDRQYYSYIFSLIVLLPASLYLQEAFEALKFEELYQIMFIVGSLICAVSGMMLHFYQSMLRTDKNFGRLHHLGLALIAILSLFLFELDFYTLWTIPLALIATALLVFVPTYLVPEETQNEELTVDNLSQVI